MFFNRIVTGFALSIPAFILLCLARGHLGFAALVAVISCFVSLMAILEYSYMVVQRALPEQPYVSRIELALTLLVFSAGPISALIASLGQLYGGDYDVAISWQHSVISLIASLATMTFLLFLVATFWLCRAGGRGVTMQESLPVERIFAFALLGLGGSMLVSLSLSPDFLMWVLFAVCFNDIAAFFVGRNIGGPKLAPHLSPKKTVSGALGGLLVGGIVGILTLVIQQYCEVAANIPFNKNYPAFILLTSVVLLAAQGGDLAESYIKRCWGCKDSGTMLPGHGGVFDRLDATFGAMVALIPISLISTVVSFL